MFLSACILVPEGFDDHPNAHFPLIIYHDHFQRRLGRVPHHTARSGSQA